MKGPTVIKVEDIQFVRYAVTDLGRTEAFLQDFGLVTVQREATTLFMRGTGSAPFVYAAELADQSGLLSVGMRIPEGAATEARALPGASASKTLRSPGGGTAIEVQVPGGPRIELVYGVASVAELPCRTCLPMNWATAKSRVNQTQRPELEPARILRLGHVALGVVDATVCMRWLSEHLGMLVSDTLLRPGTGDVLGHFVRCDRGSEPADHHTFLLANLPQQGAHHASFEVEDLDALQQGHRWLGRQGYRLNWGVGRHLLGSQLFDYWWDPDGNRLEHYTDGDMFDNSVAPGRPLEATDDRLAIWGPDVPESFFSLQHPGH